MLGILPAGGSSGPTGTRVWPSTSSPSAPRAATRWSARGSTATAPSSTRCAWTGSRRGLRHPARALAQPPQRVGSSRLPRPHPGCGPPHLPPLPRHPLPATGRLTAVPFASALSEHPVTSEAIGEVVGAVLEAIGERPDLVMVTVTRSHAGALEDIVGHHQIRAPPVGHRRGRRRVGGGNRAGGRGDPGHQSVGRLDRAPGPGPSAPPPGWPTRMALRGLARPAALRPHRTRVVGRPVHLSGRRLPHLAGRAPARPARGGRQRIGRSRSGGLAAWCTAPGWSPTGPPACWSAGASIWRPWCRKGAGPTVTPSR